MKHESTMRKDPDMQHTTRWVALAAAILLAAPPAMAQGNAEEAARLRAEITRLTSEVRRADGEIRRTDSLARVEQAAAASTQERMARDLERRERENAALEARVRDARARIATERAREASHQAGLEELKARDRALLDALAAVTDSLLARVESGLPWDTDTRRERLLSLRRDLESGTAAPEEAFARVLAMLREETRAGDEVTLSTRPFTRANGEVINAQMLKIGAQAVVYIDDEGKRYGILEPRGTGKGVAWEWREDLTLSERNAVRRAVAVKAGREAPQLAPLSIPLAGIATGTATAPDAQNAKGAR